MMKMTNDLIQDDFFPDEGSEVPETEDCSADAVPAGTSPKKRKKETADERGGKRLSDTAQEIILEKKEETAVVAEKKLLLPDVISMTKYFCDHYRLSMFSYLNRCLKDGSLEKITKIPFKDTRLNKNSCEFKEFSYWRTDRESFYMDVFVHLSLKTVLGLRDWYGTLVISCGFSDEEDDENIPDLERNDTLRNRLKEILDDGFYYYIEDLVEGKPDRSDCLRLSPFLVPYYKSIMVDGVTEEILERYLPEALWDPSKRDARELANKMGLQIQLLPLYDRENEAGILFFSAGELKVLPKNKPIGNPPVTVKIPARTIVINECHDSHAYPQFEIFHECFHYEEHYLFYRLQGLCCNDTKRIKTIEVSSEDTSGSNSSSGSAAAAGEQEKERKGQTEKKNWADPVYFMEKQADRGAIGLMMPATPTCKMILEECKIARAKEAQTVGKSFRHTGELYEQVGIELSKVFRVPHFRMRMRMIQLGFIEARGALNYADRQMIEPFAFDTDAWREVTHTFVVSGKAVEKMISQNADFKSIMHSGEYIYADGHVVRNDPRYVRKVSDREHGNCLLLTDWANSHVDACCLRFVRVYIQKGLGRYEFGRMYYDTEYIARTKFYVNDFLNREKLGDMDDIEARMLYCQRFPRNFTEAFQYLRISNGISMKDMAEKLGMNQVTLKRWIESPMKYRNEDFLTAVALVLKLPDWISRLLFKRASVCLDEDNTRHMALDYILRVQSCDGIKAANEYLANHGLDPLAV